MAGSVKRLVKAVMPPAVISRAVETRNFVGLATVARQSFDLSRLRVVRDLSVKDFWKNAEVEAAWDGDGKTIAEVYGAKETYGGVNPGERRALYYLIKAFRPEKVLEVGTHVAASTLHIALALKSVNPSGNMTSVDIADVNDPDGAEWKRLGLAKCPLDFARALGCAEQIKFVTEPSLQLMRRTQDRFDLIFLDGSHTARTVYLEVSAALKVLREGGLILLHDYHPGAKSVFPEDPVIGGPFYALERIKREAPGIHVLPLGDLPWPTKQGVNTTSLALVGSV
jgi:predicted O-methyltransferase YrrM